MSGIPSVLPKFITKQNKSYDTFKTSFQPFLQITKHDEIIRKEKILIQTDIPFTYDGDHPDHDVAIEADPDHGHKECIRVQPPVLFLSDIRHRFSTRVMNRIDKCP